MAPPAPRQTQRGSSDEALEILRRLEPIITELHREQIEQRRQLTEQGRVLAEQQQQLAVQGQSIAKLREDMVEVKDRLAGIEIVLRQLLNSDSTGFS